MCYLSVCVMFQSEDVIQGALELLELRRGPFRSICLAARPPFSIGMAWTLCRSPSIIGRRLPMADKAPLLFSPRLGGLFPANAAAQKAMQDITGKVRVEIKQTRGNMRRMALYWAILSTAAPILSNMIE